jgi:hypothetical protein
MLAVVVVAGFIVLLCPQAKFRRQFIVDLAGPAIPFLLAPVLIAGLWCLVRRVRGVADQDLAEALRQKTEAETRAWKAERRCRRTERTLEELCRAVSRRLARLSEMEVNAEPGTRGLHKQLLEEVLADFQGCLPRGLRRASSQARAGKSQLRVRPITSKHGTMGRAPGP